jgi:hypothetical protein
MIYLSLSQKMLFSSLRRFHVVLPGIEHGIGILKNELRKASQAFLPVPTEAAHVGPWE